MVGWLCVSVQVVERGGRLPDQGVLVIRAASRCLGYSRNIPWR